MGYDFHYHNKDEDSKKDVIRNRLNILFLVIFLVFCTIIIRLSYVQLVKGEEYSQEALAKSTKELPIQALRGRIYDRNGELLVANQVSFTATFEEENWMSGEYVTGLAHDLELILDMPAKTILHQMDTGYNMDGKWIGRREPKYYDKIIKYDLTQKEIALLSERKVPFRGIQVKAYPLRKYIDVVAPQTVGYVRKYSVAVNSLDSYGRETGYLPNQLVGMDGIELSFEDALRGKNGTRTVAVDSTGTFIEEKKVDYPEKGNDVYLTIDKTIQVKATNYVDQFLTQLRKNTEYKDAKNAYVVVMEVDTGKVIAMVSFPTYNPKVWLRGISTETYQDVRFAVNNGTIRWAPYDARPLGIEEASRHPGSIVPSGSVVKPITVLMGLNEGLITPNDRWRDAAGGFQYGNGSDVIHNFANHFYGWLTPQRAIKKSANTYMARIGVRLTNRVDNPVETFQHYYHAFGLGIQTGIQLPFEDDGTEDYVSNSKTISTLFAMVQASFGQQERYTALQLATYAATMAKNGKRLRPLIAEKIVSPEGEVVKDFKPEVLSTVEDVPQKYFDIVKEAMEMVTDPGGTSYAAMKGLPFKVAAKTGTSDQNIYVQKENGDTYKKPVVNSTYTSYAPANDPQIAVAVVVPGVGEGAAADLARGIYDLYQKNIGLKY